jgi:hypothetical protein
VSQKIHGQKDLLFWLTKKLSNDRLLHNQFP